MADYKDRLVRAAKLESNLYEEVEADVKSMPQAMGTVVLSGLAAGIGSIHAAGATGIFVMTLAALLSWYIWAYITYLVGTKLLPEPQTRSDPGELLRTIGFSSAPGIIRVLGIIPWLAGMAFVAAGIWMLVAMVIAVRQALDYKSTWRAVGVCLIGWVIQILVFGLIASLFGGLAQNAGS